MGFKDLRDFIQHVEDLGELRRIDGVDWNLEIGAVTEVAAASPGCPMLLFDNIKGLKPGFRVASNLLHTERRLSLALGESNELRGVPLVRKWKDKMEKVLQGPDPVEVHEGPIQENILTGDDVDLYKLPAAVWHELDGGRYFAGVVSIVRDPDEGWVNLGIYRLQVQDKSTLSLYIEPRDKSCRVIRQKYWDKGLSCPIAVSLGHAPPVFIGAAIDAPWGVSEYKIAGELNGGPIPVVRGHYTGLPVPATAEVVLEGEIPPPAVECHDEGPFGEATGYYASGTTPNEPVIKLKCIMHRNDPIIQGAPPMVPTQRRGHFPFLYRCVNIWNDLEKCGISDIQGVYQHGYGFLVISIKQRYAGQAKQAALIAAGSRASERARFIVTVDEDIDPYNMEDVLWAMSMRSEPERDVEVLKECWSGSIDPAVPEVKRLRGDFTTGKTIIIANNPVYRRGEFPAVVSACSAAKAAALEKWGDKIK
ncbi:MAG: UbiD family decarboxylase [Chloroflexi bacterium]|nr:UbiD family decarboxylase [Chloroflexota bacterium]